MNIDSVEHVVAFAHNIGFDVCALEYVGEITREHIEHSRVDGIRPDPYFIRQGDSLLLNQQRARELKTLVPRLVKAYARSKTDMYTPNVDTLSCKNLYKGTLPATKCHEERNQVTVDPYGNVIVCPFFQNIYWATSVINRSVRFGIAKSTSGLDGTKIPVASRYAATAS